INNELILVQRWGLLALVVLAVVVGRFLYVAYAVPALERSRAERAKAPAVAVEPGFVRRNFNKIGATVLILYPVAMVLLFGFQGSLKWVDNFGIQILIYVMLAWGLNIVIGLAGLLDLGYVAFYAVGAYAYALLGTHFGLSFWILLPAAGAMAAFWGVMLGFPVLR
ncbi:MAG: branched-chain amino acid ABC transporter permease, partial [Mesorhizobium sp.]